jgi:hypothetical protein
MSELLKRLEAVESRLNAMEQAQVKALRERAKLARKLDSTHELMEELIYLLRKHEPPIIHDNHEN